MTLNPSLVSLTNAAPETLHPTERDNLVGTAVFRSTCALCHGPGIAGAPRLDHREAWLPRLAAGVDVLYQHAIDGYRGEQGLMPPRGGNPSLTDDEVRSAVDYMISRSQSAPPARARISRS
ncbi:MAG: cytochrome c5 family protein [Rhodocyclaceae bacterium]|nr:cytochrome c5 family protein [Rhodocyclaceae bacterium]